MWPHRPSYWKLSCVFEPAKVKSLALALHPGVKLRGIPPDLRSGTSCLRSTTSNDRSGTSQLRSGTLLLGSTTLHSLYLVGGREPHVCFRPFGFELRPSSLSPTAIHHLLLSNLNTACTQFLVYITGQHASHASLYVKAVFSGGVF